MPSGGKETCVNGVVVEQHGDYGDGSILSVSGMW